MALVAAGLPVELGARLDASGRRPGCGVGPQRPQERVYLGQRLIRHDVRAARRHDPRRLPDVGDEAGERTCAPRKARTCRRAPALRAVTRLASRFHVQRPAVRRTLRGGSRRLRRGRSLPGLDSQARYQQHRRECGAGDRSAMSHVHARLLNVPA